MAEGTRPCISVLAGPNGAGKSSVAGRALENAGGTYLNPDRWAQDILNADPTLTLEQANIQAWHEMVRLLRVAIGAGKDFVFETTLGGETITGLLMEAAEAGFRVQIWYVALASADLHVERVTERVASGGHSIPERRIRERYDTSRVNLVRLLPYADVMVFDNSAPKGFSELGVLPEPLLVLQFAGGHIEKMCAVAEVPDWAKPIVGAALDLDQS